MKNIFKKLKEKLSKIFGKRKEIKLGFYGPPNAGKTSLANKICQDWIGEDIGTVSKVPHETREVKSKEKVVMEKDDKRIEFKVIDTPGIATRIDFEDFLKFGLKKKEAQTRAREATQGIIESIRWLDDMDAVVVVIDATTNPYSQINITIIGNLAARKIPVLIVANKMDLSKADIKKIIGAFPEYPVVGISTKTGKGIDNFYTELFKMVKNKR